jgi:hypothetical protein
LNDKVIELGLDDSINVKWNVEDDDSEDNIKTVGIQNNHKPIDVYRYLHRKQNLEIIEKMERD